MTTISSRARLLIAAFALLLVVPVATIPLNDEAKLRLFHNRALEPWPRSALFAGDPARYFRQGGRFIADRAGPIVGAAAIQKKLLIYALGTPPQRRITLGNQGYIFVNGASEDSVNGIFKSQCIDSPSEATYHALGQSLAKLRETGRRLGVAIHAVAVPMTSTLYADHLPRSVPRPLREACLAVLTGTDFLPKLDRQPELNFIYPFAEMKALRDIEGFFPKANYHPRGMSLKVIRDAYLRRARIDAKIDETLEMKQLPSEILGTYGVTATYPQYVIRNDRLGGDAPAGARIDESLVDLFKPPPGTKVYTNTGEASRTALLLSDSVGIAAAPVFAMAFKRLVWVYTNGMKSQADVGKVFDRVRPIEPIDTVVLLLNVGSASTFVTWTDALAAVATR